MNKIKSFILVIHKANKKIVDFHPLPPLAKTPLLKKSYCVFLDNLLQKLPYKHRYSFYIIINHSHSATTLLNSKIMQS